MVGGEGGATLSSFSSLQRNVLKGRPVRVCEWLLLLTGVGFFPSMHPVPPGWICNYRLCKLIIIMNNNNNNIMKSRIFSQNVSDEILSRYADSISVSICEKGRVHTAHCGSACSCRSRDMTHCCCPAGGIAVANDLWVRFSLPPIRAAR